MDPVMQISNAIQQNLDSMLGVPFMSSAVTLGLAFYAYKAAPELPSFIEEHFQHIFLQIVIGFMVIYMATQNVMLSLVVSVVFIYGMRMLTNVKEGMFGGNTDQDVVRTAEENEQKVRNSMRGGVRDPTVPPYLEGGVRDPTVPPYLEGGVRDPTVPPYLEGGARKSRQAGGRWTGNTCGTDMCYS